MNVLGIALVFSQPVVTAVAVPLVRGILFRHARLAPAAVAT